MTLELGVAKIDITPEKPVPLAGFAIRENQPYSGIASRIFARVAFFRTTDSAGIPSMAILISADLLWWGNALAEEIRTTAARQWKVPKSCILLHGTHSHSGPQTSEDYHSLLGAPDPEYLRHLKAVIYEGIELAFQDLEQVELFKHRGECRLGVQRRVVQDGKAFMQVNRDGLVDPELLVYRFRRAKSEGDTAFDGRDEASDGEDKALFVHYAVHPVISRENLVSGEFLGEAMKLLEQSRGERCTAFYLQGCCGDINVDFTNEKSFLSGTQADIKAYGEKMRDAVENALQKPGRCLTPAAITGKEYELPLQFEALHDADEMARMAQSEEAPYREWAMHQIAEQRQRSFCIQTVTFGADFTIMAMNSEMVVEYGLYVKRATKGKMIPLPYTNGMIGYVPTAAQLKQGGYEAEGSIYYFNLPGKLARDTEQQVKALLEKAIRDVDDE